MGHLNVEIKARCDNHEAIRKILLERGADYIGLDHQVDTYFKAPRGRLKLREGNIENFLIFYERENQEGPKQSNVITHRYNGEQSLKEMLTRMFGVLVVVDKKREIYFIDNVKFHIDVVQGLGNFVEIEAIDRDGTIGRDTLYEQCQQYLKLFQIAKKDLLAMSYSDMLLLQKGF